MEADIPLNNEEFEDNAGLLATRSIVAQILGNSKIQSIRPLSGGEVNRVFDVNDLLIVRIRSGDKARETYAKEKWCIDQADCLGVNVPKVVATGIEQQFAFIVQEKIKGTSGTQIRQTYPLLWFRLGEFADRLHNVTVEKFGSGFLNPPDHTNASWEHWVEWQCSNIRSTPESDWLKVLNKKQYDLAIKELSSLSTFDDPSVFCHANIGERNCIVDDTGVVYLIDWGSAGGYPAIMDLAEVCAWHEAGHTSITSFCDGYGMSESQFHQWQPKLELLQLWRWLSSINWAIHEFSDWTNADFVRLSLVKLDQFLGSRLN